VPGLGTSFGRGGATTAQQDLAEADCILIEGSSMAEAHPVGFRWVMKAKERGATIIHVDPRFSRTSAMADLWVPIRSGTDIVFLGALVRHVIETEKYFKEYVTHFTNAAAILRDGFIDPNENGGFFSGWDEKQQNYDEQTWKYETEDGSNVRSDLTLQHPRCVFQTLRRHFARYTPEVVQDVCGIPPELFYRVADALTSASGPEKTAAFCYAVGFTHQSKGVQIIRSASILQLLLGNIGRPGGGILALRGHASIQGSTDIPTLYDILPGYLSMPRAASGEDDLAGYCQTYAQPTGLWHNTPKYIVSLLKAYYGKNAHRKNDFGFNFLPKLTGDHSHFPFTVNMVDGNVEGMFVMGQNPAAGSQNARLQRRALAKLKWLVVRELVETETASFWYQSPEIDRGELKTDDIGTEIFFLPAAAHVEKEGAFTNTQRLIQWREKAIDPPGDCRSETWFIHQLAKRLRAKAASSGNPMDDPLLALDWWYPEDEHGEAKAEAVLAEINGWKTAPEDPAGKQSVVWKDLHGEPHHGPQLDDYMELKDDGSTASGCWIYTGSYGSDGVNKAHQRKPHGRYGHGWGFAWPSDRRILYNRASARPDGQPWSERKKLIWWDEAQGKWVGDDVPYFVVKMRPDYRPEKGAVGLQGLPGDRPFILHGDGFGWLHVPKGLADGPMPTHYEPLESPVHNALYPRETNPGVNWFSRPDNRFSPPADPRYPFVLTTYRLTEHHTAGGMSRFLSHLNELQPELFVEMSPELGALLGVANGDHVIVATLRGAVGARAMISRRTRPLQIAGRTVHQVAMPFHWGYAGPVVGGVVNDLLALSGEPNVTIMESKALACTILPGRMPTGLAARDLLNRLSPPEQDPVVEHPEQNLPGHPPSRKNALKQSQGQQGQPQ
jgi:formate dehydrogenase major subunit